VRHTIFLSLCFLFLSDDIELIQEQIDWIYEATSVKKKNLESLEVSRIFPVMDTDLCSLTYPVIQSFQCMGDDIIYYADNLSKLLANEIFSGSIYNVSDFESPPQSQPEIKFLAGLRHAANIQFCVSRGDE
jgi:hypothetical protein